MKKGIIALAMLAAVALPTLAEDTINFRPTGARLAIGPESTDVVISYQIDASDVNAAVSFGILLEQFRGGVSTNAYYLDILGLESDGVNCASGGNFCSGNCRMKIDGVDSNGKCGVDSTNPGGDVVCICSATGAASLSLAGAVWPGDEFVVTIDWADQVVESDETDNTLTFATGG